MRIIPCLALVVMSPISLGAAEPAPVAMQAVARFDGNHTISLLRVFPRQTFEIVTRQRERPVWEVRDGKRVKKFVTETEPVRVARFVIESVIQEMHADDVDFFDVSGNAVGPKAAAAKLKSETPVVISTTGACPAANFLSLLESGTLVLAPGSIERPTVQPDSGQPEPEPPVLSTQPPAGPPPRWTFATIGGNSQLKLRNVYESTHEVPLLHDQRSEGEHQASIRVTDLQSRTRELDAALARVFTRDGKPVSSKDAAERLKKEALVIEPVDGELPDAFYLRGLKKDALILIVPQEAPQPDGGPAPPAPRPPAAPAAPRP